MMMTSGKQYFCPRLNETTQLFLVVIRKDVLEQKVKKALEEIGFSKKVAYKVYV